MGTEMIPLLEVSIYIIVGFMILLALLFLWVSRRQTEPKEKPEEEPDLASGEDGKDKKKIENYGRFTGVLDTQSIYNFMEFDEIVDNMIVRKKGQQYLMILACNGVNYDLMSEDEKIGVEEGFFQFLNTLRFPIQLYIQSRTLNLRDIIAEYKNRVDNLTIDIDRIDAKIAQAKAQGNKALREKLEFERRRKVNILEYGISITDYVEKLSSNKNVLQQKTYVVVSYYAAEIGGSLDNYSKEEIYNMCFSELYTRCQNISSALASSQVSCQILDSEELAELLYVAYNRDEAEFLQFNKALDAQYDALYSTGKDVLKKKQEKLDQQINIEAIDLATDSILKADKQKQIEDLELEANKNLKIQEKANELLDSYKTQLDPRIYELAKENVDKATAEKAAPALEASSTPTEASGEPVKRKVVRKKREENEG